MDTRIYRKRIFRLLCAVICSAAVFLLQYRYDNKYQFHGGRDFTVLTYDWEYYPQQLLGPGEFDGKEAEYIYLGQYGGFESSKAGGSPHGCATYRKNLRLSPEPREYALELPEIYSASRIWVNGRLVSNLGDVTDSSRFSVVRTGMVTFQAENHAEIVVQAADSSHYYSGMVYPPAFGTTKAVSDLLSLRLLRTCIMVIASFTIGILYLLIGLKIGNEQRQMTLFAAICLMFTIHVMYPLLHLFEAGNWSYRLEDAAFHLFLFLIAILHCSLCGIRGRARKTVLRITGCTALVSVFVPALFLNHSLDAMMVYSTLIDSYKLLLCGWMVAAAFFSREQGHAADGPLLAGLCVIAAALLFQTILPVFEPVRFGWQTENAGFVFILLLAGGLWFDTVSAYAGRTALAENIRLMKNQFSLQEENYRIIAGNFEEIRRIRHDLRHHLLTIKELAAQHQYRELEHYISGCEEISAQAARPVLCENQAANAVLNYYLRLAEEKQIPMDVKVSLPSDLKLEGWNLGILLGNLLENAIDASECLPPEKRMITVYSRIAKGNLLLTVKNHWDGNFSPAGEQIDSTKHPGPGIGLASVRSTVEKNDGQFYLVPGMDEFEVSIVLWKQV